MGPYPTASAATVVPFGVKMTPRDEILAAGNTNISLWSQNSAAHPHLDTEYVPRGAPAGVNTPAWEYRPTTSGAWILFGRLRTATIAGRSSCSTGSPSS